MKFNKCRTQIVLRVLVRPLNPVDACLRRADTLPDVNFGQSGFNEVFNQLLEHGYENNT